MQLKSFHLQLEVINVFKKGKYQEKNLIEFSTCFLNDEYAQLK